MPTLTYYAACGGIGLLSLVFFANALAIVDPARAIADLTAAGFTPRMARANVAAGRMLQLVAGIGLFFPPTRLIASVTLFGFLAVATLMAHAFWRSTGAERNAQLTNFMKNVAILGGLLIAATWGTKP